jgi:hypothetical protein
MAKALKRQQLFDQFVQELSLTHPERPSLQPMTYRMALPTPMASMKQVPLQIWRVVTTFSTADSWTNWRGSLWGNTIAVRT